MGTQCLKIDTLIAQSIHVFLDNKYLLKFCFSDTHCWDVCAMAIFSTFWKSCHIWKVNTPNKTTFVVRFILTVCRRVLTRNILRGITQFTKGTFFNYKNFSGYISKQQCYSYTYTYIHILMASRTSYSALSGTGCLKKNEW